MLRQIWWILRIALCLCAAIVSMMAAYGAYTVHGSDGAKLVFLFLVPAIVFLLIAWHLVGKKSTNSMNTR